ncbi:MAG: hypothetical protein JSR76_04290 [Verrucomicrobia bacterium]|nr:hypothetical protein [Verrucomicrobiota bacterium]
MQAATGVRVEFTPVALDAEGVRVRLSPATEAITTATDVDRVVVRLTPSGEDSSQAATSVRAVFSPVDSRAEGVAERGGVGGGTLVDREASPHAARAETTTPRRNFEIFTTKNIGAASVAYDTGGGKERIEETFLRIKAIVAKALCQIDPSKGQIASDRIQDFRFEINPQTRRIRWQKAEGGQIYTGSLRDEAIANYLNLEELETAIHEHSLAVQQPYRIYDKGRPGARGAPSSLREDVRPLRREMLPSTAQDLVRSVGVICPSAEIEKMREAVRSVAVCEAGAEALLRAVESGLKVEGLLPKDRAILEARKRELEGRDRWALATALAIRAQHGSTLSSGEAQKLIVEALQKEGLGRRGGALGFVRHKVLRRAHDPLTREDLRYVRLVARLLEEREASGDYVIKGEFSPFEAPVAETGLLAIAESFAVPLPSRDPPVALPAAADAAPAPAAPEVEDPAVEGSMEYFFGGLSDPALAACKATMKEEAKKIREMQTELEKQAASRSQEVIDGAAATLGRVLKG